MALELQSSRRFRDDDGVAVPASCRPAEGLRSFRPGPVEARPEAAQGILERVNSETGLALKDDPALAWVTLLGEVSLFDLIDDPDPERRAAQPLRPGTASARATKSHGHRPAVLANGGGGPL